MNDDQEIGAELHRMAATDPLGPIDSQRLLARGRRGRKRRRILSASGAVAAVSAVALAATLLPNVGQADTAPADSRTENRVVADSGGAFPGTPTGDAALAPISSAEALRRCRIQWTVAVGKDPGPIEVLTGEPVMQGNGDPLPNGKLLWRPGSLLIVGDIASKVESYNCVIGGNYLPSKAELAAVAEQSIRTDDQSVLRRCSAMTFQDLRRWKVLSKSIQANAFGAAVAVSPSGKYVAHCYFGSPAARKAAVGVGGKSQIVRQWPAPTRVDGGFGYAGVRVEDAFQTCKVTGLACEGWLYHSARRVPLPVAKLTFEQGGRTTTVSVRQGWYALAWAPGDKDGPLKQLRVTAYRADGSVIKSVSSGPIHKR
ncbi:hypothetical protein [Kribbella deserti]|uniref:Uncharacterized protein n=1 Tax=Kribbella deserti TaxID=1926257 RepID=A0ABV6QTX2_9ACTN